MARFRHELHGKNGERQQTGKNHDERNKHFEGRAYDGSHFCGAHILGGQDALDNEEIGSPVAHGDDGAETEDDAGPVNAHGIVVGRAQGAPEVGVFGGGIDGDSGFETVPATGPDQAQNGNEQSARPNQDKLENFVEDGGAQSTEGDVDGHSASRYPDAEVDVPAEDDLQDQRHGVHVDAAHEHSHEREANGRESTAGFSEAQFQIAGNGMRFGDVVERHHDQREESMAGIAPIQYQCAARIPY